MNLFDFYVFYSINKEKYKFIKRYPYQITKNDMFQFQNNRSNGLILSALHWLMEIIKVR